MDLEHEFIKLSTKFLFISCNTPPGDNRTELNTLLNDLSSLNYRAQQIADVRALERLIESLTNIPTNEDTLIVKACFLLKALVNQQKLALAPNVAINCIHWLIKCLERCFYQVASDVLGGIQILLKHCGTQVVIFYDFLLSKQGVLINLLTDPNYRKVDYSKQYDHCSTSELYLAALLCLESVLACSEELAEDIEPSLQMIGNSVLDLVFKIRGDSLPAVAYYTLLTSALNCLRLVVALDENDWSACQLGRLLGCAKAYIMFAIPGINQLAPKKIPVSHQGVPEPQDIPVSKGGKIPRTRKTKKPARGKKSSKNVSKEQEPIGNRQPYSEQSFTLEMSQVVWNSAHSYRTSDSEFSESESSRTQVERHKLSKLRHAALRLIGTLAQQVEKRIMFGYWHSLFADETRTPATVSLLNCVLKDPSPRCRIAAIQTTSFLLFKSKPFLIQAESSKKPLVSFTPFSVTLGNLIIEMYQMISQALTTESDLTVLTQILKCLTVFIQATPFHRLRPGIATNFVVIVRPLVQYRDPTVKVAALMVMGFLLSLSELTEEISELLEIPKATVTVKGNNDTRSKTTTEALNLQVDEEEFIESDKEDMEGEADLVVVEKDTPSQPPPPPSWLLKIALNLLGVHEVASAVMVIRMECLQMLSAMTAHYAMLRNHLPMLAVALKNSLGDVAPEIRLCAGRVLDMLGHAIHTDLLLHASIEEDELAVAVEFWLDMLPIVTEQIQDSKQTPSLRAICCDALGNIGVHVFEKLKRDRQLALVSLLTGCTFDEDSGVTSAAARALSVFILFPSLRDDVCYIENTVESILRILKDSNISARVKTSWSLGNITDALILNNTDPSVDRISDQLLLNILESALTAAADCDKVRCNAVRTIGNVLHLTRREHLSRPVWLNAWQQAVEKLVQNILHASNAKVKWNACYAVGNMMKNQLAYDDAYRAEWQRQAFPALCKVVIESSNFKVRINAAVALAVIEKRAHYGTHFHTIWCTLLLALEQSDNLQDYNEFKRRDTLQEQLCLSLTHFLRLAGNEDLPEMANGLLPQYDAIRQNWVRVMNRILPEKGAKLMEVYLQLNNRLTDTQNGGLREALRMITQCLRYDVPNL